MADLGNMPCPICKTPLWFYRVYQEPLTENEDATEIGYTEWDDEYVKCPSCDFRPPYEWYEQVIVLA